MPFWVGIIVVFVGYVASQKNKTIPLIAPMTYGYNGNIGMEQAKVCLTNYDVTSGNVYVYGLSDNCYNCLYMPISLDPLSKVESCFLIDTQHGYTIAVSNEEPWNGCYETGNPVVTCPFEPSNYLWERKQHFDEYGEYNINITIDGRNNELKISIQQIKSHSSKYIPLWILLGCIGGIIVGSLFYVIAKAKTREPLMDDIVWNDEYKEMNNNDAGNNDMIKPKAKKERLVSLDAFRGMSLIIMIFVNYGGGGYWWLNHSTWNGLTVADLVFPWFMFIMGTAMAIVFPRYLKKIEDHEKNTENVVLSTLQTPDNKSKNGAKVTINQDKTIRWLVFKVIWRAIKLIALGLILNNGYYLKQWRIPGVLQYFGLSYLVNSLLIILTEPSNDIVKEKGVPELQNLFIPEIVLFWKQWIIIICILTVNICIQFLVKPIIYGIECPTGYLGPGGIGDKGKYFQCTGGIHRDIDIDIFGDQHIYPYPTAQDYYGTGYYDPEGTLGLLNAISLTFFGLLIGRVLHVYSDHKQRLIRWLTISIFFCLIAGILCKFNQNNGWIPINKNLWSTSFILVQAGTGTFVLLIMYILIDVLKFWDGTPFHWLGSNSIFIYVGSELLDGYFPFGWEYGDQNHYKLLLSNVIGVGIWIYTSYYLYKHKIFYKL